MAGIGKRVSSFFSRAKDMMLDYSYLVTLAAAVAIIAGSAMYTEYIRKQQEESRLAAANAAEITATALPPLENTPLPTIAPITISAAAYKPKITTVKPASGEIIRAYSREPVRWEAMGVIQAHEAIDIAGEAGESVCAAMDGVVMDAWMDALWGWTVVIAHTDGSEGAYAGLGLCFVRAGDSVSRGEEIGTLMDKVPCEAELSPHLHFEMTQNGNKQDPEGILPE